MTATDEHGNTATVSDTLEIDTITDVTINSPISGSDNTVNLAERNAAGGVMIRGTAEAGATVEVTLGSFTHTVTANSAGVWTTTYAASEITRGEYNQTVTARSTDLAGNVDTATTTVRIDTEISVTVDTSDVDGPDGVVNMVERSDGITLHGTADAGATVEVRFHNGVHTVTANAQGIWSADFPVSELPQGNIEGGYPVTVKATDAAGNSATTTGTVKMDTWVNTLTHPGPVEGDDIINAKEASDGITLTGQVEAGSRVFVTFDGTEREATVTGTTWSVSYGAGEIRGGDYDAAIQIRATDAAGNTRSITDTVHVDTVAPDAPDTIGLFLQNTGAQGGGVLVTQVAIADSGDATDSFRIHSYDSGANGKTLLAVDADGYVNPANPGRLDFYFDRGDNIVDGKQLVVTQTDVNGNSNSTLLVLDEQSTNVVDVKATGLDTFNIGAIDMSFADKSELSLTKADIDALSANDNVLVIHGATDDIVTFTGGTATLTGTETINGETYNVYSVGGDTVIKIDDEIQFNSTIV